MRAILGGRRKSDFGRINVKLEGALLEIPHKHRILYSPSEGYILKKSRESARDYHPYLALYTREKWMQEVLLRQQNGMDLVGFLNDKIELDASVANGVHFLNLPEDFLQYLRIRKNSIITVLCSGWPGLELWKPGEFKKYETIERYALGLEKVLH